MGNNNIQQERETTQVNFLRNGKVRNVSVSDFLAQMEYNMSHGEPLWYKSTYYGKPLMFLGDMDGKPVFIGPYRQGDGIEIDTNPNSVKAGTIKMRYPIPVITGNGGKVLAVNESETGLTWIESNIRHGTKEYWREHHDYMPKADEIIVFDDYYTETGYNPETGEEYTINYPRIKIGTGNGYVTDLKFIGEYETNILQNHIYDMSMHVSEADRKNWNFKVTVNDINGDLHGDTDEKETLVFTREDLSAFL